MKMILKNICSISDAEIEFNGITVIAGENNTGKSTISRALFSSFYSLSGIVDKIQQVITDDLILRLRPFGFFALKSDSQFKLLNELLDIRTIYLKNEKSDITDDNILFNTLNNILKNYFEIRENDSNYSDYTDLINYIIGVIKDKDTNYKRQIINRCIKNEFKDKISSVFNSNSNASIELFFNSNKEKNSISVKNDEVVDVVNETKIVHNILYIDGQDIDYYLQLRRHDYGKRLYDHKSVMDSLINFTIDDKMYSENNSSLFSDFNGIGEVYVSKDKTYYKTEYFNEPINPAQISQGLKSIIILRQLFLSGHIRKKSFIVLDEPEINLHPKWQLYLAKLLCRLSKELDVHIMLCSHSPYFISAIVEYSKNINIDSKCNYYLTENDKNTHMNKIIDCSATPKRIFSTLYESVIDLREINNDN